MYQLFAFIFQNSFFLRGNMLFIFGLIIGSFLNVVIYRLPIMLLRNWRDECRLFLHEDQVDDVRYEQKLNLFHPRSHCPSCKANVPFWANIPLLGYILLGGKCRQCKVKIPLRYPLIELVTGLLFLSAGYYFNDPLLLGGVLVFVAFILVIIMIDYAMLLLPDELTLTLLWLGLLFNLHGAIAGSLENAVFGAVIGYLFLYIIFWAYKLFTKKDGMGYGDFKLLAAILAFGGYTWLIPVILLSSCLGIMYFIVGRLLGKFNASTQVPFGVFLGIAGLIMIFGNKYIYLLSLVL